MCTENIYCPNCQLPLAPWEDYCSFCSGEDGDSPILRKIPERWCDFDDDRYEDREDQDDDEEEEEEKEIIIHEEPYTNDIEVRVWGESNSDFEN